MRAMGVLKQPTTAAVCYFCGEWPACLYKNIGEKHSHRVCENCVAAGRVIKNADGIYVVNPDFTPPELPAEPAGSPA